MDSLYLTLPDRYTLPSEMLEQLDDLAAHCAAHDKPQTALQIRQLRTRITHAVTNLYDDIYTHAELLKDVEKAVASDYEWDRVEDGYELK